MARRVMISGTNLASAGLSSGASTFVLGLANAVAQVPGFVVGVILPEGVSREGFHAAVDIVSAPKRSGVGRVVTDALRLDAVLTTWKADLFHYPHEWCPRTSKPTVTTVQNIAWLHPASRGSVGERGRAMRALTKTTYRRSAKTIAVSPEAASLWLGLTGADPRSVTVLPQGFTGTAVEHRSPTTEGVDLLGVVGPWMYKNERLLLDAYQWARARGLQDRLLLAGVPEPRLGDLEGVEHLGVVDRPTLLGVMASVRLTAFPSVVESFGLPALESVFQGTPALVPVGTAMEYWLRDSVVTCEPTIESLGTRLFTTVSRKRPEELERFQSEWSWDAVVARWCDVYDGVLKGR